MIDLLRLCRLYYAAPMAFIHLLTVCYAVGNPGAVSWPGTILSSLALAMVIAAGYVINDVCDANVDRINAPRRPIAAGRVKPVVALGWAGALLALGLLLAAVCRWPFLPALSAVAAVLLLYDLTSKRLGVGKQLLVAALMTSIYPLAIVQAGGLTGSRAGTLAFFPAWLFLTSFGYEGLKDIRDMAGDRSATGHSTWIHRHPRWGRRLSLLAIVAGAVVLIGPCLAGCGWVYMSIAFVAMLIAALTVFLPVRRALVLVYIECVVVGVAASADLIVSGL